MATLQEIDDFIYDASDQAAAWYSIVTDKPVVLPSANISSQDAIAASIPVATSVQTPIGSYIGVAGGNGLFVLVAAIVVVVLVMREF